METKTIKCQCLQIVDEDGKVRMILSADSKASTIVFCEEDSPYMQIMVSKGDDANLMVLDRHGKPRVSLGMFASGDVGFAVMDPNGITRAFMGYDRGDSKATIGCEGKLFR